MIEDLKADTFGTKSYKIGLADNSVRLLKTPQIPDDVWAEVMALRDDIIGGEIKVEPMFDARRRCRALMTGVDSDIRQARGRAGSPAPASDGLMLKHGHADDQSLTQASTVDRCIVELEGVTKRFPGVVANDSVDLAIRPGEVHVLLGENGAGKSTLIGMLSGLLQPDEGEIRVDGRPDADHLAAPSALSLGIGTVFQHVMLVPTLTVAENLALGGPLVAAPQDCTMLARESPRSARPLGIDRPPAMPPVSLSLGEQQQVEIVRALLRGSRVLILDEATSMLTPQGVEELGALMRRLVERGLAIVFITHKLREAFAFGDRISILRLRPQGRRDRAGAAEGARRDGASSPRSCG